MYQHTTPCGVTLTSTATHPHTALGDIAAQARANGLTPPTRLTQIVDTSRPVSVSMGAQPFLRRTTEAA